MASENTDARRARVAELWVDHNRKIAEILIEEGLAGKIPRTADAKTRQLAAMIRNVQNDRVWWKKHWRAQVKATAQDVNETRGEYLTRLGALLGKAMELFDDVGLKGTPRVQALAELRQLEQLRAKAQGVAEIPPALPDGDDGPRAPFLGIVIGLEKVSPEVRKQIDEWNRRDRE